MDASKNSLRSLDYLELIYGPRHNLVIDLLYVLPALPPILTDKETMNKTIRAKLKAVEQKNTEMAEQILSQAKTALVHKKFYEQHINPVYKKMKITVARDIVNQVNFQHSGTVLLKRQGQSDLKAFFMGSVTHRILEYHPFCSVWILDGLIRSKKVLLCIEGSEHGLRTVDHTGFMLSGTDFGLQHRGRRWHRGRSCFRSRSGIFLRRKQGDSCKHVVSANNISQKINNRDFSVPEGR
jgi:hypothetical protein